MIKKYLSQYCGFIFLFILSACELDQITEALDKIGETETTETQDSIEAMDLSLIESCENSTNYCLDKAWSLMTQLDSGKTLLDSLFWVREAQAYTIEVLQQGESERAVHLFALGNELKWPLLQAADSTLRQVEKLTPLSPQLLELEKSVIETWYLDYYSLMDSLNSALAKDTQAMRLLDLKLRLADLNDIQRGVLPERELTWNHRMVEWGRQ